VGHTLFELAVMCLCSFQYGFGIYVVTKLMASEHSLLAPNGGYINISHCTTRCHSIFEDGASEEEAQRKPFDGIEAYIKAKPVGVQNQWVSSIHSCLTSRLCC
jgi:hypothetical protein